MEMGPSMDWGYYCMSWRLCVMWGCLVNEAFIVMKLGCNGAVMAVRMSVDWDFSAFVISKQIFCGPPGGGQSIFFFQ